MSLEHVLIDTPSGLANLLSKIKNEKMVALDTEFIRETTFYPILELIQVATLHEAWLIDYQAFESRSCPEFEAFKDFMQSPSCLKILHAAQGDQECFYTSLGKVATPSLDTAVAASLCGLGEGIGLGNLVKAVLGVTIKKGHARTNWSVRPLPKQLLEYAVSDVQYLVEVGQKLLGELEKHGRREWALEASARFEVTKLYDPDPKEMADRLFKSGRVDPEAYFVLLELVKWRESRVKEINVPRRRVADDGVLLDLARVRPRDIEHLSSFRGLNRGESKQKGHLILDAIKRGMEQTGDRPKSMPRANPISTDEQRAVDLLKAYVGILADEHRISSGRLLNTADCLALIRSRARSPQEWVEKEILPASALEIVGQELFDFLNGKKALSLDSLSGSPKVKVVKTE